MSEKITYRDRYEWLKTHMKPSKIGSKYYVGALAPFDTFDEAVDECIRWARKED